MWLHKVVKRIRSIPSSVKAAILFIFYTVATKPIENVAEYLSTMNNLLSSNITLFLEKIGTSATDKDFWVGFLQVVVFLFFILLFAWLFDSGKDKDIQELRDEIRNGNSRIIEELKRLNHDEKR